MKTAVSKRLRLARLRNQERDIEDRRHGFLPPSECPVSEHINTIREALMCALQLQDLAGDNPWDCVAEAVGMLEDLQKRFPRELERSNDDETI